MRKENALRKTKINDFCVGLCVCVFFCCFEWLFMCVVTENASERVVGFEFAVWTMVLYRLFCKTQNRVCDERVRLVSGKGFKVISLFWFLRVKSRKGERKPKSMAMWHVSRLGGNFNNKQTVPQRMYRWTTSSVARFFHSPWIRLAGLIGWLEAVEWLWEPVVQWTVQRFLSDIGCDLDPPRWATSSCMRLAHWYEESICP